MADEINVIVVKRKGLNLYLRYIDPIDGKRREKNSGTTNMKQAQRAAGEWQAELNAGGASSPEFLRWEQFREDFRENYLKHYSDSYANNVEGSLNVVEELMSPDTLARISEKWLARFHSLAKARKVSAYTVRKYFQHLQTALKWAKEQGLIKSVPVFPKQTKQTQRGAKLMKGRPITGEEFDRMLAAVPKVVQKTEAAESLTYLLRGLWLSGLRLGEALSLTWDQWADGIRVSVDEDNDVCLMIDGGNQKNRQALTYPVVDDFAEFLLQTPDKQREGFVFNAMGQNGKVSRRVDTVSTWLVNIGKAAKVKVDEKDGSEKFASAHDIRRAFGTRWAKIVPASLLQKLMRHSNIETTMSFYVNITAKDTLSEIRRHVRKNSPEKVNGEVNEEV
ncbi:MAG: site-specific integrase [Planctomycetaceae bacterium]|nr:site-specific integrase [Planctomycetaceae bacterium]